MNMFHFYLHKSKNIYHASMSKLYLLLIGCILCVACSTNNKPILHSQLAQVEEYIIDRDYTSAYPILIEIDTALLTANEKLVFQLYTEHILFQSTRHTSLTTPENTLISSLEAHGMYRYVGQALLLKATALLRIQDIENALVSINNAEKHLLNSSDIPDALWAELYYRMAIIYKADGLLQESDTYCQRAIEYAKKANHYFLVAECFKMLGNTHIRTKAFESIPQQEIANLYDSALYYHELNPDKKIANYHNICYNKALYLADSVGMFEHGKYLVDSCEYLVPASTVASYYLKRNVLDSAWYYIQTLRAEPSSYRDTYEALMAIYMQTIGYTDDASQRFRTLYEKYYEAATADESRRTHSNSLQYNIEKTQREKLELEKAQQHSLVVWLAGLLGAAIVIIGVLLYIGSKRRAKMAQEQRLASRKQELHIKRYALNMQLMRRLEFARQMTANQSSPEALEDENIPAWVRGFIDAQLLSDGKRGRILCKEFNDEFYHMLDALQADYPDITPSDLLMCTLITLRLSISDVCVLMNMPKRTVWNRRNRIKEHLGLTTQDDLEQWLDDYAWKVALQPKQPTSATDKQENSPNV